MIIKNFFFVIILLYKLMKCKYCSNESLTTNDFYECNQVCCKLCLKNRHKEYHDKNKQRNNERSLSYNRKHRKRLNRLNTENLYKDGGVQHRKNGRERSRKLKIEVLQAYCNGEIKCARCPFNDTRALSIDHVNGDGAKHRRTLNHRGSKTYRWLKKNNFPPGFQVLCMNCQWIKRFENKEYPHRD